MKRSFSLFLAVSLGFSVLTGCANFDSSGRKGIIGGGSGAIGGALIGQAIGRNTESTLIGVAVGGLLGYIVGNEMDKYDRQQINQALETVPSYEPVSWQNPSTQAQYSMTAQPAYQNESGQYCRPAQISSVIDGKRETVTTTACRDRNGSWALQS